MDVRKAIIESLKRFPFVSRVILFGSRARKDHTLKSDYDLAVDCPTASPKEWALVAKTVEEIPTLLSIQLIRYNTASQELKNRIQEEGVVLYEQKN